MHLVGFYYKTSRQVGDLVAVWTTTVCSYYNSPALSTPSYYPSAGFISPTPVCILSNNCQRRRVSYLLHKR